MSARVIATAALALLLAGVGPGPALAQTDSERLRAAKALFFDRDYAGAREAWQAIARGGGREAQTARYWVARCSESLGESERALGEYGAYLDSRPADRTLAEEARTSRAGIAVALAQKGQPRHLGLAREALSDPSRTVRYFAALRLSALGAETGRPAVPVLKEILAHEKDEDLVERAKLALLRIDRSALAAAEAPSPRPGARQASWVRVRIYERGAGKPKVSINLPVALAELVFKSLPDDARADLRRKGYDADNFWEALKKTGPADILSVEGGDGERVQVWIE